MRKKRKYSATKLVSGALALLGGVGWIMLVVPELHFLYKQLIPAMGEGKYVAFLLMGIAMFYSAPVYLTRKAFILWLPDKSSTFFEKVAMGFACVLSVMISRAFM